MHARLFRPLLRPPELLGIIQYNRILIQTMGTHLPFTDVPTSYEGVCDCHCSVSSTLHRVATRYGGRNPSVSVEALGAILAPLTPSPVGLRLTSMYLLTFIFGALLPAAIASVRTPAG